MKHVETFFFKQYFNLSKKPCLCGCPGRKSLIICRFRKTSSDKVVSWRTKTKHGFLFKLKYWLTVVDNSPCLIKFGNFYAPKSWSLLHLLTSFFLFCQELSDEQLWPWNFFYTNLGKIQPIWKIVEKCYF